MSSNFNLSNEEILNQWLSNVRRGPGYLGIRDHERWNQKYFRSNDELVQLIKNYKQSANLYVSMACFEYPTVNRTKENAAKLCSFWLDLDSHGGGKYRHPEEALLDVKKFIFHSKLPAPSYIHHTGHGIHVLWATNEEMSPSEWLPTAQALRYLAEDYGLDVDGEITTDAARVLRIPFTINFRDPSSPISTKLLEIN